MAAKKIVVVKDASKKIVVVKKKPRIVVRRFYKKKPLRGTQGGIPLLSLEEVEKLFDLYCKDFKYSQMADALNVSTNLVRKYVRAGDPLRGIEPFEIRRSQIVRAALLMQSGKVTQRMAQRAAALMQTFSVVNGRFLSRIAAAAQLDDPELYRDPRRDVELQILQRKALEPTSQDLVAAVKLGSEIDRLSLEMEGAYAPQSPVTVNVNSTSSASSMATQDMEKVYKHLTHLGMATDEDRVNIGRTVRDISYMQTASQLAEANRKPSS